MHSTQFYPILSVFLPSARLPPGRFLSKNGDNSGQGFLLRLPHPGLGELLSPGVPLLLGAARGERVDDVSGGSVRRGVARDRVVQECTRAVQGSAE